MSADDKAPAKVGYRSPPVGTRFKKGQSGNPKGRARGRKSMSQHIFEELQVKVELTIKGKKVQLTMMRVIAKKLVHNAANGNDKAIGQLLQLYRTSPELLEGGRASNDDYGPIELEILKEHLASILDESE